jgi:hypothetical protein
VKPASPHQRFDPNSPIREEGLLYFPAGQEEEEFYDEEYYDEEDGMVLVYSFVLFSFVFLVLSIEIHS